MCEVPLPKQPVEELRANFVAAATEICEHAKPLGITVLMEPLNQYEAYPGVLTTLEEAVYVVEAVPCDNIGIQPDISHMSISESNIYDALRAAAPYIHVVHTNETNHRQLGTGHADYPEFFRMLKEINFNGYLTTYLPIVSQEVAELRQRSTEASAGVGQAGSDADARGTSAVSEGLRSDGLVTSHHLSELSKPIKE